MRGEPVIIEFTSIHGKKLALKSTMILEMWEGADGNAGIVLDLLDKPTVWLKDSYKDAFEKWKDTQP